MRKLSQNNYLKTVALCFFIALISLFPLLIYGLNNQQYFSYIIDYNQQMVPFNTYIGNYLHNYGSFSWATDLGSGFINSYTYYGLFSPFSWPLYLLPSNIIPWAMPFFLCFKYAIAGGGAYLWLTNYTKKPDLGIALACIYAFSGQMIYNLLYFFFLDAFALFPYLLYTLDNLAMHNKKGYVWGMVFICAITNYLFFVEEMVFLAVYIVCMVIFKAYHIDIKRFIVICFEIIGGTLTAAVVIVPSAIYLLQSTRATSKLLGSDILYYDKTETYLAILKGLFMLPDRPGSKNYLNDGAVNWSTPTNYLPLIGITGVLALYQHNKKHPFIRLLFVLLVFAVVPVLNSSFMLFNANYYSRWYFMAALIMCGASCVAFNDEAIVNEKLKSSIKLVAAATCLFLLFAILPASNEDKSTRIGVVQNQLLFWIPFIITIAGMAALYWLVKTSKNIEDFHQRLLIPVVLFCSIGSAAFHILAVADGAPSQDYIPSMNDAKNNVSLILTDTQDARIDVYTNKICNLGVLTNASSIQSYSSTVAPAITRFYNNLGIERSVSSNLSIGLYGFRGLLSVKYLLVPLSEENDWIAEMSESDNTTAGYRIDFNGKDTQFTIQNVALTGWNKTATTDYFAIYENENFVPMGFAYDSYITSDQLDEVPMHLKSNLLMKGILLSDEQIEQYGDILSPLPDIDTSELNYANYISDCQNRKADAVTSFTQTPNGFSATTDYNKDKFVFFSVPYDIGFTATVNGEKADIIDVDDGMMALRVPAGHDDIIFTYHTPGLKLGASISTAGIIIWLAYILIFIKRRKHPYVK